MDEQRNSAHDAYRRGALEDALKLQREVVACAARDGHAEARDFLFLAFLLHSAKQIPQAIAALREGIAGFPQAAELHENMGVLLREAGKISEAIAAYEHALALGSTSLNVLDGLCMALGLQGRTGEALGYGRRSLEAKDSVFGAAPVLGDIPQTAPPPFNTLKRAENVISYCLWGDNPRYVMPLLENLRILNHLFPAWTIRVYLDSTVPDPCRAELQKGGAQIHVRQLPQAEPLHRKLLWRFDVLSDPQVRRFLIRDADSLLSVKERIAVDAWIGSAKYFHLMRDFFSHTDLILAGLWGGVNGVLPPVKTLLANFKPWRMENDHVDQDLLTSTVWPTVKRSCLIHDSVFTGCLDSVPFPPYADLLPGHHIGQNAYIHFRGAG